MDQPKETKIPLAGEMPETKLPQQEPTVINLNEAKDYSHLPVGTQASIELDKKLIQPTPLIESTNNIVPKSVLKNDYSKKFFKSALAFLGVFGVCFVIFLILSVTNVDTQFIKITLNGVIKDANTGEAVKDASVFLGDREIAKTNDIGYYSASNMNYGDAQITVKADGYDDLTENVKITKVLLDYSTRKDFSLKSSLTGVLSGKLIPNTTGYKFTNDQLTVDDKQYKINDDGTFSINGIKVGDVNFKYLSVNYKDINQTITLQSGTNKIPDITLVPGGDIIGELKSYIKEDLVLNTKFYVENILQDQVTITEEGKFAVKDLDTSKKYKIRVTADGYRTRDYEINIAQGENQLFNFKLVENGVAIYPKNIGSNSNEPKMLYSSDFDGQNAVKLSDDKEVIFSTSFYSIEDQKLYYQSTSDRNYPRSGGNYLALPYAYDLSIGVADKMTANTSSLQNIYTNFVAKKMLNTYRVQGSQNKTALQVMNIDGTNRQDIKTMDIAITVVKNLIISNNGNVVVYGYEINGQNELYIYHVNNQNDKQILEGKDITAYDISEDGNLILASRRNPNTNLIDLILINVSSDDLRTLKENIKGSGYQFQKGNTNKVLFFEERESRSNIYTFTVDRSQEERITSLTPDYTITGIYQESNLLFYFTNKGLLVLDINKPKNFKLVAADAFNYMQ